MGLFDKPPTRSRTYTAATPVDANDLNDMQDAEIDARGLKHLLISPYDFQKIAGAGVLGSGGWSGIFTIRAGIRLPAGVDLQRLRSIYTVGGGDMYGEIKWGNWLAGGGVAPSYAAALPLFTDAVAGTRINDYDLTSSAALVAQQPVAEGWIWELHYDSDNAANAFYGAVLSYYPL